MLLLTHRRADASFRVRWERYLPALREAGFMPDVREIPKRNKRQVWQGADVVVLHRRLLRSGDLARLRRQARVLIYDVDDALCYRDRAPFRSRQRERRFFETVAAADLVLAGNAHLARLARLRADKVRVVPSAIDVEQYEPQDTSKMPFTAVWIGQSATLPHLEIVRGALLDAGIAVRVIADRAPDGVEFHAWSQESEARLLAASHVGLMPLPDTPFTRGKCGYKLLQYYAAGIPVIASPVGVNRSLAAGGAILARASTEWVHAVCALKVDPARRAALGAKGRAFVARRYAASSLAERLVRLLGSATR